MKKSSSKAAVPALPIGDAETFHADLLAEYGIHDSGGKALAALARDNLILIQQCQAQIDKDGLLTPDGKAHPLCNVMRDAKNNFLSALRVLDLEPEPNNTGFIGGQVGNFNKNLNMKKALRR